MTWGSVAWGGIGGDGYDSTPPVINNFVPDEGAAIERTGPLQFDVTDNSGQFAAITISARYLENGTTETIYNGVGFEARYLAGSARTPIAYGYRFYLRRTSGWLITPVTFTISATDRAGNTTRREITL